MSGGTGTRRVPRLCRYTRVGAPAAPAGTWLLAGGLGGLGLATARGLAGAGVRSLVLLGRGAPGAGAVAAIAGLRADGVDVAVVQADVADAARLEEVLGPVLATRPALGGVIHAAASLDDAAIIKQSPERFEVAARAKVEGAWNLHCLASARPEVAFVMFGSAAGLLGSPGQANYAAADAFLGALARHRRARGLHGLAIAWGPWAEVGRAAGRADEFRGFRGLAPATAVAALLRLLAEPVARVAVMAFDPEAWRAGLAVDPPLLARFPRPLAAGPVEPVGALRAALVATGPRARPAALAAALRAEVAEVLRISGDTIAADHPIASLGMDSLLGLELRNRLARRLGLELPGTLIWRHPTLAALGEFLLTTLQLGSEAAAVESAAPHHTPAERGDSLAELAALSDAEVRRRIRGRLT